MSGLKKIKYFIFAVSVLLVSGARASNNFGAGVVLGDPTGLSFKYNLSERNSIDGALAWSGSVDMHMHADYLWNRAKLFYLDSYPVDLFYGIGARLLDRDSNKFRDEDDSDMQLAARAPVGLRFMFHDPRIEIFTELALLFTLVPSTDADLDFGLGARYFF